jgi:hypothetical protein
MRRLLTVAALATIPLLVPSSGVAAKKVTCKVPAFPTPAGAFDTLSAKIVSCKTAQSVVVAYQKCRLKNGPTGRCVKRVKLHWECAEERFTSGPSFQARARCIRKIGKPVNGRYKTVYGAYFTYHQSTS